MGSQKELITEINSVINALVTNFFINNDVHYKLYVCHYIFCSYALTKNNFYFNFAANLLQETIKITYQNRKKNKSSFYSSLNYYLCISVSLGIELDIDELIEDIPKEKQILQLFGIYNLDLLNNENDLLKTLSHKISPSLIIVLQIRNNIINRHNYINYIHIINDSYRKNNNKEYFLCIAIISYLFGNQKDLNLVINQITQTRSNDTFKRIINLIKPQQKNTSININFDTYSLITPIKGSLKIDLAIINSFLLNAKLKLLNFEG